VKAFSKIVTALLVFLLLGGGLCAYADDAPAVTTGNLAGNFAIEQVYINVPVMDVFVYASDETGEPFSPTVVQAAGVELRLGDTVLETGNIAMASEPICYIVVLDNSEGIAPKTFDAHKRAVARLIAEKGDRDQLMLYTMAGGTQCVLPATDDRAAAYKALHGVKQQKGETDFTKTAAAIYADTDQQHQALPPRRVIFAVTDTSRLFHNLPLLLGMMNDTVSQLNMAVFAFVTGESENGMDLLSEASSQRIIPCTADTIEEAVTGKMEGLGKALEIKTTLPEDAYGEKLEEFILSVPALGSAVQCRTTVYMGHRLLKPAVESVVVTGREELTLTFNQPISETAVKPQFYQIVSDDVWNWHVRIKSVVLNQDGQTAILTTEPLYAGGYTAGLRKVASRMTAANVSDTAAGTAFSIDEWPRDRAFYFAQFRLPLALALAALLALTVRTMVYKRRERQEEQAAEARHLLDEADHAAETAPRRWVTLFIQNQGAITEHRWFAMVEGSIIIGSDPDQCDLVLLDKRVHTQHAILAVEGDTLLVCPLGEKARVKVNGIEIKGEMQLKNNDILRLGATSLRLVL